MIISKCTIEEKWDVLWFFHDEIEDIYIYIYHRSVTKYKFILIIIASMTLYKLYKKEVSTRYGIYWVWSAF